MRRRKAERDSEYPHRQKVAEHRGERIAAAAYNADDSGGIEALDQNYDRHDRDYIHSRGFSLVGDVEQLDDRIFDEEHDSRHDKTESDRQREHGFRVRVGVFAAARADLLADDDQRRVREADSGEQTDPLDDIRDRIGGVRHLAEVADNDRMNSDAESPEGLVADYGQAVAHEVAEQSGTAAEHTQRIQSDALIDEYDVGEHHQKLNYTRNERSYSRALDAERGESELAEDEYIVHADIEENRGAVREQRDFDLLSRAHDAAEQCSQRRDEVGREDYSKICDSERYDLLALREQPHDLRGKQVTDGSEYTADYEHGYGRDSGDYVYRIGIALAPILRD